MLQIIGWLGCFMLAVKLMEMGFNPAHRGEDGSLSSGPLWAITIGWIGVAGFAFWLLAQGGEFGGRESVSDIQARTAELRRQNECMERAGNDLQAIVACTR